MATRAPLVIGGDGLPQNLQAATDSISGAVLAPASTPASALAAKAAAQNLGVAGATTSLLAAGFHLASLPNGNFEDLLAGWTYTLGASTTNTVTVDPTKANVLSGTNAIKLFCPDKANAVNLISPRFPVSEGVPFEVTLHYLSNAAATSGVSLYPLFLDAGGNTISQPGVAPSNGGALATTYQVAKAVVRPPAGARFCQMYFVVVGQVATVWVDEIQVQRQRVFDASDLRDFGAVGDGATDDTFALQVALTSLAQLGGGTLCVGAFHAINPSAATTLAVPANVELRFGPTGRFVLGAKATLSVVGRINAGATWIFDTTTTAGGVVATTAFCLSPIVLPEWWGAAPTLSPTAPTAAAGSDCAPAITAALAFVAPYPGKILFRGLFYNCKTGFVVNTTCDLIGAGEGLYGATLGRTMLDFSSAAGSVVGIAMAPSGGATTLLRASIKDITISCSTTQAKGSGGSGLNLTAAQHCVFDNVGVYGFDTNLILTYNFINPCIANSFRECWFGAYGTRSINLVSQTATVFENCEVLGNGQNEVVLINAPQASGGGSTQDTSIWRDCRIGNNRTSYPSCGVQILGGFWHHFDNTDVETCLNTGILINCASAQNELTPIVIVDQCWFDDCGVPVQNAGLMNSIRVTNCPRMVAAAAGSTTQGGATTSTPGGAACVYLADSAGTNKSVDVIISGNNMQALKSNAVCIVIGNAVDAGVYNNRCQQFGAALGNQPITISSGSNNIVTGNRSNSTAAIYDSGSNDMIVNNINF